MKVITLMNQKGGAGKSTVARALLSAADEAGIRSAFIDADQTGNLGSWAIQAASNNLWSNRIEAFQSVEADEVSDVIDELHSEGKVDLLILDTAGDASRDHDVFASVADLVLCPILLSRSDLLTARGTANYLYRMRGRVENTSLLPPFGVLLNRVGKNPTKGDLHLLEQVREHPLVGKDSETPVEKLNLLNAVLSEREAYKTMDGKGLLGQILRQHNASAPRFRQNPKYLTDAMKEVEGLLTACLKITGGLKDD